MSSEKLSGKFRHMRHWNIPSSWTFGHKQVESTEIITHNINQRYSYPQLSEPSTQLSKKKSLFSKIIKITWRVFKQSLSLCTLIFFKYFQMKCHHAIDIHTSIHCKESQHQNFPSLRAAHSRNKSAKYTKRQASFKSILRQSWTWKLAGSADQIISRAVSCFERVCGCEVHYKNYSAE